MLPPNQAEVGLGPCCICQRADVLACNVLMLPWKGAMPGTGWGCRTCGLPNDGCVSVVCDACLDPLATAMERLVTACAGRPGRDGRVPIEVARGGPPHAHDLSKHPELGTMVHA